MPRYEVTLEPEDLDACRRRADRIKHWAKTQPATYTGVQTDDADLIGCIGELAFSIWCNEHNIEHSWTTSGHEPDEQDFVVRLYQGPNIRVDVKHTHREGSDMMIPLAQFQRRQFDAYVGSRGRLEDGRAIVILEGIVSRRVLEVGHIVEQLRCPTVLFPFRNMTRLEPDFFQRNARRSA